MISIKIFKNGIQTHGANQWNGQPFLTLEDAHAFINYAENKPSHPWGRPAGWYKLIGENTIEFMGTKNIKPEEILESRIIKNMENSLTEVRLNAEYIIKIVNLDLDVNEIAKKKKQMIKKVRELALEQIEEKYTSIDIGLINSKAILALSKGNALSTAFNNMLDFVGLINNAKGVCIDSIKACTTMEQLRAIVYNGITIF